ncbi:vacuolar import/degradation protein Vid24 [Gorgonomyces haynaldii]|nr:vacuolar import/degradation protein Vid24 [Gorgonomyces haynaldii]
MPSTLEKKTRETFKTNAGLYPSSVFKGHQNSGKSSYQVLVELKHVDLRDSFLCGYLKINNLTEEWPELCTYFEAEIIGPKHSFLTRKWDADESIDVQHWSKFPHFENLVHEFNDDHFVYDFENSDFVYMRWKEHFLVPDHKIKTISGASFAGFYYICYQKSTRQIMGLYFHQNSEWFQHLSLEHVPQHCSGDYDFR